MRRIQRLLVPVDFSDCSARALAQAFDLALQLDAEVEVLHIAEPPQSVEPVGALFRDAACRTASTALALFVESAPHAQRVRLTKTVDVGPPRARILEHAKRGKHDLIVIGTHGTGDRTHALIGGTAHALVREAACPVLTVGSGEAADANPANGPP
jgi:nucleotide-binding universal stress UspA family protein